MASLWDEIKSFFKSKNQLEAEKNQAVGEALSSESSLVEKLKEIESKLVTEESKGGTSVPIDELFPETLGLTKKDMNLKTDAEIAEIAQNEYSPKLQSETAKLNIKYDSAAEKEKAKADAAKSNLTDALSKIQASFEAAVKNAKTDAVDSGTARGSILSAKNMQIEGAKDASVAKSTGEFDAKIADIDRQLKLLDTERDAAITALDLDYAAKISQRITALEKEREATELSVIKHNNSVTEKETAYLKQREQDIADYLARLEKTSLKQAADLEEHEKEYGYSEQKQQNYAERYGVACEFYFSLSPEIAVEALAASPNMKYYLGNYYDQLMSVLKSRSGGSGSVYY